MVQKFIQGDRGEKMANPHKTEVKSHAVDGLGAEKQMIKVWEGRELFKRNKGSAFLCAIKKGGRNQTSDQAAFL